MKKLIFAFALMFGAMFVACNNNSSKETTDNADTVEVAIDSVATDSVTADTVAIDSVA